MNYFAHALPFLDQPYYVAGTAVPDMLMVVDRRVRIRSKHVAAFVDTDDPTVCAVARGMAQHFRDDAVFHDTRAFAELSLALAASSSRSLGNPSGMGPRFLGHLLVELLLDAELIAEQPDQLDTFYRVMESIDAAAVEAAVNQMAPRPTQRLAPMFARVCQSRFLSDYLDDGRLWTRLNQIMHRVGLDPLPERFQEILPNARRMVANRRGELLEGIPS